MKKFLSLFLTAMLFFAASLVHGQSLYEVSDQEKVGTSTLVFEGHVVGQQSFKTGQGMILTDNAVRVYKLFRGNIFTDTLHILTQGGQVGDEIMMASDLLWLEKGDYGLFFANPNVLGIRASWGTTPLLDVFSSSQGFYRMDWLEGNTSTPFRHFSLKDNVFYNYLKSTLKLPAPAELHPLDEYLHPERYVVKVDTTFSPIDTFLNKLVQPLIRTAADTAVRQQRTQVLNITSISPVRVNAGATADVANNLLTITGTDFGNAGGSAAVLFDDANDGNGGTDWTVLSTDNTVVSWTNTQIQIRVPSRAGSGLVKVRDQLGSVATAPVNLQVFYSILAPTLFTPSVTRQLNLANVNGLGGYNLLYSTNLPANTQATVQRALNTWKQMAGFNVTEAGSTGITAVSSTDGFNVVMLDNAGTGNAPLASGVLAVCYSYTSACNSSSAFYKSGFDIVIRNPGFSSGSISFEVGPCAPASTAIDLESVVFHELGHAINLGHVNDGAQSTGVGQANPSKVMHYAISFQLKRTSPDASALQGALSQTNNTTSTLPTCAVSYMQPLTRTVEAKDECPLGFPTEATFPGTIVNFDLEHSSSNVATDPQYNNFNCVANSGTAITNTAYYALRTNAGGQLDVTVSDFVNTIATQTGCSITPGVEMALYQVNTCPAGQNYPAPVACRTFTGNGSLASFTGLLPSTTYLVVVDGAQNTKATFKLTFSGAALPVKLRHFVGYLNGPVNTLQWSLEAFSEVAKVVLERSTENNQYVPLTTFDNSMLSTNRSYVFDDAQPVNGINYYRLAIFNKNGSVEYSQVVLLNRTDGVKIGIRPNPVRNQAQLNISAASNIGNVTLQILNADGKRIYQQKVTLLQGQSNYPINIQIPAGTYFVTLVNNKGQMIASQTLLKQ